ncbi:MAG: MFS transporter [Pseudomonadales bacterium]|nr:MFS transporter [Pseudomonadales bacterium]
MRAILGPIAALLLSQALLLAGHGLQLTVLPLRATLEGFTDTEVAFTGSAYFAGFVLGCLLTPRVVRRAGHIRAFAVMASLYSAVALIFDLLPNIYSWLSLRVLTGVTIAGLYMILESWLNERATPETRGTLLSVYTLINLTMIIAGQQLVNVAAPEASTLFALSAILLSLAVIPVSLTRALAPAPLQSTRIELRSVLRDSPVAVGGTLASGFAGGAFWALGPVYAAASGLATGEVTRFLSVAVLGGVLLQVPLGRMSDHYDRRLVLLGTALFGVLASIGLASMGPDAGWLLYLAALAWGAFVFTIYAICLAHANDNAEAGHFVAIGTAILLLNGAASAVGGPVASMFMDTLGPAGLFWFSSGVLGIYALQIVWRLHVRQRPAIDETEPFRPVGEVTPVALEMDPRVDSDWIPPEQETGGDDEPPAAAAG